MKQLLTFLCALLFALAGKAAPAGDELKQLLAEARAIVNTAGNAADREVSRALSEARRAVNATDRQIDRAMAEARRVVGASDREIDRAIAEARAAIDAAETAAVANQSIEELNKAAREQVVRELGLTSRQRKEFEPLYKAYREALDKAVNTPDAGTDEAAQRQGLKTKLSNIAATAQVKRDYVDKFAAVLTAEQIRRLYNTEGEIGTNIKRAAVDRRRNQNTRLKGSGRMVTQDWGKAGDYTGISAAAFFDVTVSPTARTISVTADDNVIDYLVLERDGGTLKFRVNANNTENISVSVVVPASAALRQISAGSYGKVTCKLPLKGPSVAVSVSSYGSVIADIDTPGTAQLNVSSYGKFSGSVRCNDCELRVSSYGSAQAPVDCRNNCQVTVGSYAKFSNDIKASVLTLKISSGASVSSTLISDALTQVLRRSDGEQPAGETDRQQRRLVQRHVQREFARGGSRQLRQDQPERVGTGRQRRGKGIIRSCVQRPRAAGRRLRPDRIELCQGRRVVLGHPADKRFDSRPDNVRRPLQGRIAHRQHTAQKVNTNTISVFTGKGRNPVGIRPFRVWAVHCAIRCRGYASPISRLPRASRRASARPASPVRCWHTTDRPRWPRCRPHGGRRSYS